ncbi:MAG: DUF4830 domain-containing protein [Clostridia bacterium]|nr:DUF4830 domain-containing protein [Clostridia bacterium]
MRKLLCIICAIMLALPLSLLLRPQDEPAHAETPAYAIITLTSNYGEHPTLTVEDAAFLRWLRALLTVDAPCEPLEYRPANKVYEVTFYGAEAQAYVITHNDLYDLACVRLPDGTVHAISVDVPMMLSRSLLEPVTFGIPETHDALLQKYGWTAAFRHPHMPVQLPQTLSASRTDAAALYFTWTDIFLRDAGYDITPYLGQAVIPYVYTVYESMPRALFYDNDASDVRCSMFAVVLECDGQVIGAYLFAHSWDGSCLMSLKGNAAPALLSDDALDGYLLSRLPMTASEAELAALTPEEVIIHYGAVNDPSLMAIGELLRRLGTASSTLYDPLALTAIPTGDAVTVLRCLDLPNEHMYEVQTTHGLRFPELVYESDATGWKIVNFYNTGF